MEESRDDAELVCRAGNGDRQATSELLAKYRDRLTKMVRLRLDRRLYGRVDPSDIVQDATIEAVRRLPKYAKSPPMGFFLWLRWLTGQKLTDAHRHHLGAQKRAANHEVSLYRGAMPEATSMALAAQLLGQLTSPSEAAQRAETQMKVQEGLNNLHPDDREVLVLRHFEHLSNDETAQVLGVKKSAASKRFIVALKRLKEQLQNIPGFDERF